jgi:hypothetical protein
MATKKLTVPQNGTQPVTNIAPIDNMILSSKQTVFAAKNKKPTSFNIDNSLFIRFKSACVQKGQPMSKVIEDLMEKYVTNTI